MAVKIISLPIAWKQSVGEGLERQALRDGHENAAVRARIDKLDAARKSFSDAAHTDLNSALNEGARVIAERGFEDDRGSFWSLILYTPDPSPDLSDDALLALMETDEETQARRALERIEAAEAAALKDE